MIESIRIKNIALINETIVEFDKGLNIISGETGTGKSIIVNSINLLLGERADRDMIKSGCDYGEVEAVFFLDDALYCTVTDMLGLDREDGGQLIVSRKISADGRNTCRINGAAVSLSSLKGCMDLVADLHGQHAHQSLLYSKNQLQIADRYASQSVAELKDEIESLRNDYTDLRSELEEISKYDSEEIEKQLDYLRFQEEEIAKADLKAGEDEELESELKMIENAEENANILKESYEILYGGEDHTVLNDLNHVIDRVAWLKDISDVFSDIHESLNGAYYTIEDAAHDISRESGNIRYDEQRISEIRDRLDVIYGMRRKYGETVEGILNYRNELEEKIDRLSSVGEKTVELEHRITDITDKLFLLHNELLDARKKASGELEVAVKRELEDLGMSGCSFSISFDGIPPKGECDFSQRELTRCEFMISTNPGEQERPLSKVASGGEISRIMLAFKNVFANVDDIDVLIFDEIDTGISGKMARVVAEKMYKISRSKQLICITHLPQIVSFGDSNYVVEKDSDTGNTVSHVRRLDKEEKIEEVSRLSGGRGAAALSNASEMVSDADSTKRELSAV